MTNRHEALICPLRHDAEVLNEPNFSHIKKPCKRAMIEENKSVILSVAKNLNERFFVVFMMVVFS